MPNAKPRTHPPTTSHGSKRCLGHAEVYYYDTHVVASIHNAEGESGKSRLVCVFYHFGTGFASSGFTALHMGAQCEGISSTSTSHELTVCKRQNKMK